MKGKEMLIAISHARAKVIDEEYTTWNAWHRRAKEKGLTDDAMQGVLDGWEAETLSLIIPLKVWIAIQGPSE